MDWVQSIPVKESTQSHRIENCGLRDDRSQIVRRNLELKPGTARKFHFSSENKLAMRLKALHSPEINGIARSQLIWITAAAPQPTTSDDQIERTAEPPQEISEVPAIRATDALDRRKGEPRRN